MSDLPLDAIEAIDWLLDEPATDRRRPTYDRHVLLMARAELVRLRHIEQKALIWAAYQDDRSLKWQETDARLRAQAEAATLSLFEAVI